MSVFAKIKSLFIDDVRSNAQTYSQWDWSWFGHPTNSGVSVNYTTALAHAGVYACIKILSESVASLPIGLFSEQEGQIKELYKDTRHLLISKEPSELYNSFEFFSVGMHHVNTDGNFYADIIRDGNRRPVELRIIEDPASVTPELDPNGKLWYRVAGRKMPIRPSEIIHLKGISANGIIGKSPITIFRENIGLGIATTRTQGSLWKNGTLMSGYLKHPQKLADGQAKSLMETWQSRFAGSENAGKTPVLENGLEFVPLTLKPQDALFLETAKLSLQDIYRIYRVPAHMVGDLERSTNNNIEQQSLEFVRDTLRPWAKKWEQELNRKLLFDGEKGRLHFRFNFDGILRGDTTSRSAYFTRALGSVSAPGWMTQNEVRALENLNPIPDGDEIYNPSKNQPPDETAAGADVKKDEQNEPGQSAN